MKNYTKTYYNFFKYDICDFIPCEICGKNSTDIHHILARSQHRELENDITNLMAVCRDCHIEYGDKKQHIEYLQKIHADKISRFTKNKP